jgi:WD40 repeat protein
MADSYFADVSFLGTRATSNLYSLFSATIRTGKNEYVLVANVQGVTAWDLKTKECKFSYTNEFSNIRVAKVLSSGIIAIGAHNGRIHLWNPRSQHVTILQVDMNTPVNLLDLHSTARVIVELPDGNLVSGAFNDSYLTIWNMKTYSVLKRIRAHEQHILCIEIIDNDSVITGSSDDHMHVWNLEKGTCELTIKCTSSIWNVRLHRNGYLYNCQYDRKICKWDVKTGECLASIKINANLLNTIDFLPNGLILAGTNEGLFSVDQKLTWKKIIYKSNIEGLLVLENGSVVIGCVSKKIQHLDITNSTVLGTIKQTNAIKVMDSIKL